VTQSLEPGDDELQPECELLLQWNGEIVGDRNRSGNADAVLEQDRDLAVDV
jgi:hypothetical protein